MNMKKGEKKALDLEQLDSVNGGNMIDDIAHAAETVMDAISTVDTMNLTSAINAADTIRNILPDQKKNDATSFRADSRTDEPGRLA